MRKLSNSRPVVFSFCVCVEVVLIVSLVLVCFVCGGCLLYFCITRHMHRQMDQRERVVETVVEQPRQRQQQQLSVRRLRGMQRVRDQDAPPYDPHPRSQSVSVSSSSIVDSLDTDSDSYEASEHSVALSVEDSMELSIEVSKKVPSDGDDARHERRSSECEIEQMRRKGGARRSASSRRRRSRYGDDDNVRTS